MKKYSTVILVILLIVLGAYAVYQLKQITSLKLNTNKLEESAFDTRKQLIQQTQDLQRVNSDYNSKEGYVRDLEEALKLEITSANMIAYQYSLTILVSCFIYFGFICRRHITKDSRKGARRVKFGEGSGTTSPRLR